MKKILHSVSYAGLWKNQAYLSTIEFINKAASFGYDGVEIMAKKPHLSLVKSDREEIEKIKNVLEETKLECACIAAYTNFTSELKHPEIPFLEMQINHIASLAEIAQQLGCKIIRVFTGYEEKEIPYWEQWDRCVYGIRECARYAAEYDVMIGIQNHHDIGVGKDDLIFMIDEINEPNCKIMFDAWAPSVHGEDIVGLAKKVADKMIYTTVADYSLLSRFNYNSSLVNYTDNTNALFAVPMGEGFINYEGFFNALMEKNYQGYVAYEMCSRIKGGGSISNLDKYAKQFIDYMKKFDA